MWGDSSANKVITMVALTGCAANDQRPRGIIVKVMVLVTWPFLCACLRLACCVDLVRAGEGDYVGSDDLSSDDDGDVPFSSAHRFAGGEGGAAGGGPDAPPAEDWSRGPPNKVGAALHLPARVQGQGLGFGPGTRDAKPSPVHAVMKHSFTSCD